MANASVPNFCAYCHHGIPSLPRLLRINLTGRVFHRLTVQHYMEQRLKRSYWCCACTCGNTTVAQGYLLTKGATGSCGCWRDEMMHDIMPQRLRRHGQTGTTLYVRWLGIIARCTNPNVPAYKNYGGRGITMCPRWRDSFATFAADMGEPPVGMHLERRNNDGPYSPENCYWATRTEQANNKRNNALLTWHGMTHTLAEWARRTGIPAPTVYRRLKLGWDVDHALSLPVDRRFSHRRKC